MTVLPVETPGSMSCRNTLYHKTRRCGAWPRDFRILSSTHIDRRKADHGTIERLPLRSLHQPPQFRERALLIDPVEERKDFRRRCLVDGSLRAGEELLLDLFFGKRRLRRAARIVAHLLHRAAVSERHCHA